MKKSTRINKIVEIAERAEQHAGRALGLKVKNKQQEDDRLNNLVQFRDEYTSKYYTAGVEGLSGQQLAQYRIFLEKMNEAIKYQEQTINRLDGELIDSKSEWSKANQKKRGYGKLKARTLAHESREQSKREQAETDDRRIPANPWS